MSQRDGDFSDSPISIGEAYAQRDQRADRWTPREALVSLLRDIDSGAVKPISLVLAFAEDAGDGATKTGFRVVAKGNHQALGLLSRVQFMINADL